MRNFLANLYIGLGLVLFLFSSYLIWQRYNPQRLAFTGVDESVFAVSNPQAVTQPKVLTIEDLDINLSVFPARSQKGKWETTTKGVSYLTSSAIPGEVGNSIFYGHNYRNILGNLNKAKPGQIIKIKFSNGGRNTFRIEYVQVVNPDQVGILDQTEDKRLTLYTCTGFLDSKRLVVTALYQEDLGESI